MLVELDFTWLAIESAQGAPYRFPAEMEPRLHALWSRPAVYRWVCSGAVEGELPHIYVGETEDLAKRLRGYLTPGPSQRTNRRMFDLLSAELKAGRSASLEVLSFDVLTLGEQSLTAADLADPAVRRLLEGLFEAYYKRAGHTLHNL
jgi:hypothetical protein